MSTVNKKQGLTAPWASVVGASVDTNQATGLAHELAEAEPETNPQISPVVIIIVPPPTHLLHFFFG